MKKVYSGTSDDWQAKMDMDTLVTARKIKMDPKRLKAALECAQKHKKALEEVTEYMAE